MFPFWNLLIAMHIAVLVLIISNMRGWPRVTTSAAPHYPHVSVLIPARNEAANIEEAVEDALTCSGSILEVLVYNDYSVDQTGEIVAALQERDQRIRLIHPQPLPDGWYGKTFACVQLAAEAQGDWLLFIDADTRLQAGAVDRIVTDAEHRGVTFLSCWPRLVMCGFWEKVFMPMLNFVVFTLLPAPLSLTQSRPALGLAHGACILARRAEYQLIGGHRHVKTELFEDTALARAWRANGLRSLCLDGQDVAHVRMYDSLPSIWRGFQKILYPAFRHAHSFWLFLTFHATLFVLPFVVAIYQIGTGHYTHAVWIMIATTFTGRAIQAMRFQYPLWSVLLHPIAEAAMLTASLASWYNYRLGKGVEWKGRSYGSRRKTL